MRIYVGNLSHDATGEDLRKAFEAFGNVESVQLITDRDSGRSKGFGFVEMPTLSEGQAAMSKLNGQDLKGRTMNVSPARERSSGQGGFSGGGGSYDRGRR